MLFSSASTRASEASSIDNEEDDDSIVGMAKRYSASQRWGADDISVASGSVAGFGSYLSSWGTGGRHKADPPRADPRDPSITGDDPPQFGRGDRSNEREQARFPAHIPMPPTRPKGPPAKAFDHIKKSKRKHVPPPPHRIPEEEGIYDEEEARLPPSRSASGCSNRSSRSRSQSRARKSEDENVNLHEWKGRSKSAKRRPSREKDTTADKQSSRKRGENNTSSSERRRGRSREHKSAPLRASYTESEGSRSKSRERSRTPSSKHEAPSNDTTNKSTSRTGVFNSMRQRSSQSATRVAPVSTDIIPSPTPQQRPQSNTSMLSRMMKRAPTNQHQGDVADFKQFSNDYDIERGSKNTPNVTRNIIVVAVISLCICVSIALVTLNSLGNRDSGVSSPPMNPNDGFELQIPSNSSSPLQTGTAAQQEVNDVDESVVVIKVSQTPVDSISESVPVANVESVTDVVPIDPVPDEENSYTCPALFSGRVQTRDCKGYGFCDAGISIGFIRSCGEGLQFDTISNSCLKTGVAACTLLSEGEVESPVEDTNIPAAVASEVNDDREGSTPDITEGVSSEQEQSPLEDSVPSPQEELSPETKIEMVPQQGKAAGETTISQPIEENDSVGLWPYFLILKLTFDHKPQDIGWHVESVENGASLAFKTAGSYNSNLANTIVYEKIPIFGKETGVDARTYRVVLEDVSGDGLCCDHGFGSYQLYYGEIGAESVAIITGSQFGYSMAHLVTIET